MKRSFLTGWGFAALLATIFLSGCATAIAPAQKTAKVVYHVNTGVESASAILNNINNHLAADPKAKIIVVTHGPGIDFLVQDAKDSRNREFSGSVSGLAARGVEFRVCNNTLVTRKVKASTLLLETNIVPSGVAEVARLQSSDGYAYVKP